MPRMSKKRKQEWALFLNCRNRITYNELCRKCRCDCKQSFRALVIECPLLETSLYRPLLGDWTVHGWRWISAGIWSPSRASEWTAHSSAPWAESDPWFRLYWFHILLWQRPLFSNQQRVQSYGRQMSALIQNRKTPSWSIDWDGISISAFIFFWSAHSISCTFPPTIQQILLGRFDDDN